MEDGPILACQVRGRLDHHPLRARHKAQGSTKVPAPAYAGTHGRLAVDARVREMGNNGGEELALIQCVLVIDAIVMVIKVEHQLHCCNVVILSPGHSQIASNS
jgi:hypothetical protein